ncbi:hypothetical protein Tco_1086798, partial [Tanacetum coccineum]
ARHDTLLRDAPVLIVVWWPAPSNVALGRHILFTMLSSQDAGKKEELVHLDYRVVGCSVDILVLWGMVMFKRGERIYFGFGESGKGAKNVKTSLRWGSCKDLSYVKDIDLPKKTWEIAVIACLIAGVSFMVIVYVTSLIYLRIKISGVLLDSKRGL